MSLPKTPSGWLLGAAAIVEAINAMRPFQGQTITPGSDEFYQHSFYQLAELLLVAIDFPCPIPPYVYRAPRFADLDLCTSPEILEPTRSLLAGLDEIIARSRLHETSWFQWNAPPVPLTPPDFSDELIERFTVSASSIFRHKQARDAARIKALHLPPVWSDDGAVKARFKPEIRFDTLEGIIAYGQHMLEWLPMFSSDGDENGFFIHVAIRYHVAAYRNIHEALTAARIEYRPEKNPDADTWQGARDNLRGVDGIFDLARKRM